MVSTNASAVTGLHASLLHQTDGWRTAFGGLDDRLIQLRPSLEPGRVGSCITLFRGLLSVYSRYGLHARQVAYATFCTEGFSSFVASATASIATGWSEPVPGRVYPRCGPPPFHSVPGNRVQELWPLLVSDIPAMN